MVLLANGGARQRSINDRTVNINVWKLLYVNPSADCACSNKQFFNHGNMYALHMSVGSFPDISESDSECLAMVFWQFLIKKLVKCSVNTASHYQLVTVSIHCAILGLITVWINDFLSPCSTVGVGWHYRNCPMNVWGLTALLVVPCGIVVQSSLKSVTSSTSGLYTSCVSPVVVAVISRP